MHTKINILFQECWKTVPYQAFFSAYVEFVFHTTGWEMAPTVLHAYVVGDESFSNKEDDILKTVACNPSLILCLLNY